MGRWGSKSTSRKGWRQQKIFERQGEVVESLTEFAYLGSAIRDADGADEDITDIIREAWSVCSLLMPVWKEKSI